MFASSLAIQTEPDALADGKRLKKIMSTSAKWTAIASLATILKPFDDVTYTSVTLRTSSDTFKEIQPIANDGDYNRTNCSTIHTQRQMHFLTK